MHSSQPKSGGFGFKCIVDSFPRSIALIGIIYMLLSGAITGLLFITMCYARMLVRRWRPMSVTNDANHTEST